jgi:putative resolvase
MKLSDYAKMKGICYRTAWRHWRLGLIKCEQLPTGTIIVLPQSDRPEGVIVYARVSSSENKSNLESQAKRVTDYCIARGYKVVDIIKEIGSGVNDNRQQLLRLLKRADYRKIVVEHKDRLTRFGFNYINVLAKELGIEIEVINQAENDKEDLMQDFVSIITSFCARLYGLRRSKRKTEQLLRELQSEKKS